MYKIAKARVVHCCTIWWIPSMSPRSIHRVDARNRQAISSYVIYMTFSNFHETWNLPEKTALKSFAAKHDRKLTRGQLFPLNAHSALSKIMPASLCWSENIHLVKKVSIVHAISYTYRLTHCCPRSVLINTSDYSLCTL